MYRANKQQAIPHAKINQKSGIRFFFIRQLLFEENYIGNSLRMSTLYTVDKIFNRLHLLYLLYRFILCILEGVSYLWIVLLYIDTTHIFLFPFLLFLFFFFGFFRRYKKYVWDYSE